MSVQCPKCKNFSDEGSKFCYECGAFIPIVKCKCGKALEPIDNFCPSCGKKTIYNKKGVMPS